MLPVGTHRVERLIVGRISTPRAQARRRPLLSGASVTGHAMIDSRVHAGGPSKIGDTTATKSASDIRP